MEEKKFCMKSRAELDEIRKQQASKKASVNEEYEVIVPSEVAYYLQYGDEAELDDETKAEVDKLYGGKSISFKYDELTDEMTPDFGFANNATTIIINESRIRKSSKKASVNEEYEDVIVLIKKEPRKSPNDPVQRNIYTIFKSEDTNKFKADFKAGKTNFDKKDFDLQTLKDMAWHIKNPQDILGTDYKNKLKTYLVNNPDDASLIPTELIESKINEISDELADKVASKRKVAGRLAADKFRRINDTHTAELSNVFRKYTDKDIISGKADKEVEDIDKRYEPIENEQRKIIKKAEKNQELMAKRNARKLGESKMNENGTAQEFEVPGFWGFYQSPYTEPYDIEYAFFNDPTELDDKSEELFQKFLDYEVDWSIDKDYVDTVGRTYVDKFDDAMREEIPSWKGSTYVEVDMPKYYNYDSDRLFATTVIDEEVAAEIGEFLQSHKAEFEQAIKDKFTSRSGFISNYSNSPADWEKELTEMDHNELSTIFEVILGGYSQAALINDDTLEELRGNGEDYEFYIVNKNYDALEKYMADNGGSLPENYSVNEISADTFNSAMRKRIDNKLAAKQDVIDRPYSLNAKIDHKVASDKLDKFFNAADKRQARHKKAGWSDGNSTYTKPVPNKFTKIESLVAKTLRESKEILSEISDELVDKVGQKRNDQWHKAMADHAEIGYQAHKKAGTDFTHKITPEQREIIDKEYTRLGGYEAGKKSSETQRKMMKFDALYDKRQARKMGESKINENQEPREGESTVVNGYEIYHTPKEYTTNIHREFMVTHPEIGMCGGFDTFADAKEYAIHG